METDREVLMWLHQRLVNVHKESPLFDYMHRLRQIIRAIPPKACNREGVANSMEELIHSMRLSKEKYSRFMEGK